MASNKNIFFRLLVENTDFARKLNLSRDQVLSFERTINRTGKIASTIGKGLLSSVLSTPMLGLTSVAGIGAVMSRAVGKFAEMQQAMADLSSLTGITGKELDELRASAINMSAGSSMAAEDIARAMTKVGSAMPELLKYKAGLVAVTDAAKLLSGASGMDMDSSINSLTGIMNQFGAGAAEANVYVNTLAAASQVGAADVNYLAAVIEKSAGSAINAKMGFSELVAVTEAIAPKFSNAQEAGTAMRNVLTRLEVRTKDCKISQLGLNRALENFSKKSDAQKIKIVGEEALRMANAMADARGEIGKYEQQITGTNVAEEQAATRKRTLKTSISALAVSWDDFTLSMNTSYGILAAFIDLLSSGISVFARWTESYDGYMQRIKGESEQKAIKDLGKQYNEHLVADGEDAAQKWLEEAKVEADRKAQMEAENLRALEERDKKAAEHNAAIRKKASDAIKNSTRGKAFAGLSLEQGVQERAAYLVQDPRRKTAFFEGDTINPDEGITRRGYYQRVAQRQAYYASRSEAITNLLAARKKGKTEVPTAGGGTGGKTDPLEHSRADLTAGGIDVKDLKTRMQVVDDLKARISEVDKALEAAGADSELRDKLTGIRDTYQAALDAFTEPLTVAGVDLSEVKKAQEEVARLDGQIKTLEEALTVSKGERRAGIEEALKNLRREREALAAPVTLAGVDVSGYEKAAAEAKKAADELAKAEAYLSANPDDAGLLELVKRLREESEKLNHTFIAGMDVTPYVRKKEEAEKLRAELERIDELLRSNPGDAGLLATRKKLVEKADDLPSTYTPQKSRRQEDKERRLALTTEIDRLNRQSKKDPGRKAENDRLVSGMRKEIASIDFQKTMDIAGASIQVASDIGNVMKSLGLDEVGEGIAETVGVLNTVMSLIVSIEALVALISAQESVQTTTSFLPFFSNGGIVGGNSWTGDKLLARVNSGEMVLNKQQQANLLNGLNNSEAASAAVSVSGRSVVRGEDIYIALNNYLRRSGKKI